MLNSISGNAYRPGGTNLAVPAPFNKFNPEHVTDVELGVKTDYEFLGIHGRTNADIYHTDYKAIQVSQVVTIPSAVAGQPPSAQQIQTNAASAFLEGVEIEQNLNLPYGIDLEAQGSYIYTHYDAYPQAFGQVGSPPFNYIPLFQFSVTPTYHVPVDPAWGEITASISWATRSSRRNSTRSSRASAMAGPTCGAMGRRIPRAPRLGT